MYSPSKRIIAGLLLCNHTLMGCLDPSLDKQRLKASNAESTSEQSNIVATPPVQEELINKVAEKPADKLLVDSVSQTPGTLQITSEKPTHKQQPILSTLPHQPGKPMDYKQPIPARKIHTISPERATNKKRKTEKINKKPSKEQYRQELIEKSFRKILAKIKKQLEQQKISCSCFISYAWHEKQPDGSCHALDQKVHQLAEYLWLAGIKALLDIRHNHLGTSISEFVRLIDGVDYVILMGSKALKAKCTPKNLQLARAIEFEGKADIDTIPVISREVVRIEALLKNNPPQFDSIPQQTANTLFPTCFLLPLSLEGTYEQVLPDLPLLKKLSLISEPMSSLLPNQALFKLLSIMVSKQAGQTKFIQEMELQFKQDRQAILDMPQDKLAALLAEAANYESTPNLDLT